MALPALSPVARCALCGCRLETPKSLERGLCSSCLSRPEAATLPRDDQGRALPRPAPARPAAVATPIRAFSPAERSLIRSVNGFMPSGDLVRVINERRAADQGAAAIPCTLEQLHTEVRELVDPGQGGNWAGLRALLSQARRAGTLAAITPQTVEDFAVVFGLTPAQLLHLKDVIAHATRD